jgi:hypothetical protein
MRNGKSFLIGKWDGEVYEEGVLIRNWNWDVYEEGEVGTK